MIDTRQSNELIEQTLPLVKHIVFQVAVRFPRHVEREELGRAGVLGLVQAARRYDPSTGVPFQRFASQRIRGAILDSARSIDWAPRSLRRTARAIEQASEKLANELGRSPSRAETAAALRITPAALAALEDQVGRSLVLALDMPVLEAGGDDEVPLADALRDETMVDPGEELENRELHAYLRDAVNLLPERHREVIVGYFFENRTSGELAQSLGVTVSRVSQLRSEAFEMLRDGIAAQFDDESPADRQPAPVGARIARRKVAYAAAVAEQSTWKARLETPSPAVAERRPGTVRAA